MREKGFYFMILFYHSFNLFKVRNIFLNNGYIIYYLKNTVNLQKFHLRVLKEEYLK